VAQLVLPPGRLPPAVRHFTGRSAELARLDALLDRSAQANPGLGLAVAAVDGAVGSGKTTLALYWAHRVAARFPDGQLYADLRGGDEVPVSPGDALAGFLEALGVPPAGIPSGLDGRAALYRSLVSDKRIAIVLDDAASADQVRPLLPGSSGCVVVTTSRSRLTGLIARECALPLTLGPLSAGEAHEVLAGYLGRERVVAEPAAVENIATRCARLPLPLVIVASRAAANPSFPLAALAGELRGRGSPLDALNGGDAATDLRRVFSSAYDGLGRPAARLFRLLGLHPGPDVTLPAAASLTATPVAATRGPLAELARRHLVEEAAPGRFTCDELLRAFAAELAAHHDSAAGCEAATGRLVDHYLHAAYAADRLLDPYGEPVAAPPPADGVAPQSFADRSAASAWFEAERQVLLAVARQAAARAHHHAVWHLAQSLAAHLRLTGRWTDWFSTQGAALDAARHLADDALLARAHTGLARVYTWLGRYDDARRHLLAALDLFGQIGDRVGQAGARLLLANVCTGMGRHRAALGHLRPALDRYRATERGAGQAAALRAFAWHHALLDEPRPALRCGRRALNLERNLDNDLGIAGSLQVLGCAYHRLGQYDRATSSYTAALTRYAMAGDRYNEADTLARLGDAYRAADRADDAGAAWQRALAVLDAIDHPDADPIRARLRAAAG
jgi:tetratricopeptide (TPR) repeat protein